MLYACLYSFDFKIPMYSFTPVFHFLRDDAEFKLPCDDAKFISEVGKSDWNYAHVSCEKVYTEQVLD